MKLYSYFPRPLSPAILEDEEGNLIQTNDLLFTLLEKNPECTELCLISPHPVKESEQKNLEEKLKEIPTLQRVQWKKAETDTAGLLALLEKEEHSDLVLDLSGAAVPFPFHLFLSLPQLETMNEKKILHLYYGHVIQQADGSHSLFIRDYIPEYKMQKIYLLLQQFIQNLFIHGPLEESTDPLFRQFHQAAIAFNEMIEFCEFEQSMQHVEMIVEKAKAIETLPVVKGQEGMGLLAREILNTFEPLVQEKGSRKQKELLIRLLMEHKRYQVAITFLDQFLREELLRALFLEGQNLPLDEFIRKNVKPAHQKDFVYSFSQLILNEYVHSPDPNPDLENNTQLKRYKEVRYHTRNKKHLEKQLAIYRQDIQEFYHNIRNHINHGQAIDTSLDLDQIITRILAFIDSL